MLIKVKDSKGDIYTMPSETAKCILEIHYSTSYYSFIVQDETSDGKFPEKEIIVPLKDSNWVDMIALQDEEIGEIVN